MEVEMERPEVTEEMLFEAANKIADRIDCDAEDIAQYYEHPMDGYQLARELDRYASWDLTMSEVEELDCMSGIVDELLGAAEKQWFAENDIQPPLPVGTMTTRGVIAGVCTHSVERYLVKETGCTQAGRFLLVKFEDAKAV
jgi:hypothetical protein